MGRKEEDTERLFVKKGGGYREVLCEEKEEDTERSYVKKGGGYREVLREERRRIQRGAM